MVGALKLRVDENEADKAGKVKKFGAAEMPKRAALGELQNRAVLRNVGGKEAASAAAGQKDLKDSKLQSVLRGTKARVDSHWKKAPLGTAINGASAAVATHAAPVQRKVLTRTNSVRSGVDTGGRSNGELARATSKPKTVTTKLVENKLQHVKYINKVKAPEDKKTNVAAAVVKESKPSGMRREDSNLSRKSLTKLKAVLKQRDVIVKPAACKTSQATAAAASIPIAVAAKKEKEKQLVTSNNKAVAGSELKIVSVQTHSSQLLDAVEDIDAKDADNMVLVSEYVNDIYDYLYSLEVEHAIVPNHLDDQKDVSPKMRAILIDWINEVHLQFHLAAETFQMTVAIIDRYLQVVKDTKRLHLQLVGVTALFIAAKYEELFPPAIGDFVYITDNTYNVKQILQMELKIFKALDCNLARPLPIHFLRRYSKAAKAEDTHHTMAKYFLELAAAEYDLAAYKPSEIAAASLFLALHLLNDDAKMPTGFNDRHWTATLEWYSRYSAGHLRPLASKIAAIARNAPSVKLKAAYTKYQSSKLEKISLRSELYGALMDSIVAVKEEEQ